MINKGWDDQEYSFGEDEQLNKRLSSLINEFCHVFHSHADGNWKKLYKPKYTEQLASEIKIKPFLIRKLLELKDPVISNVTHSAIEFNQSLVSKNV